MSNQKISQFVTVSYKGSLLLPAVDMSLPIGTQNVNILASTLGGTTINGKAPLGITATDTAMISPTTSTANVVVTIGDVDTTLSISNGSYDMQSLTVRIDQGTTPHDVSFDSGIALGTDVTSYTTSGANKSDYLAFCWNAATSKWHLLAVQQGF